MEKTRIRLGRVLLLGLAGGVFLNVAGWIGNALLLRDWWREALADALVRPRSRTGWNEALSLLPDFVYAVALVWLYAALLPRYGPGAGTAARATALVWAVGVMTTYLGVANSGLLPVGISMATSVWALVTFLPVVWLVPRLYGTST